MIEALGVVKCSPEKRLVGTLMNVEDDDVECVYTAPSYDVGVVRKAYRYSRSGCIESAEEARASQRDPARTRRTPFVPRD